MEIKQKGLKININNFTGKMILTYYFPIKNEFSPKFEEVASTYNCKIETIEEQLLLFLKRKEIAFLVLKHSEMFKEN